jgi:hypothetical protein
MPPVSSSSLSEEQAIKVRAMRSVVRMGVLRCWAYIANLG